MADSDPGILINGIKKKSISNIETLDLIAEGPIEGPVKQEYNYIGTLGATGWDTVTAQPAKSFLSSLYLNGTPVVDEQGLYNFQNIEVDITKGLANGGIGEHQYFNDWDMQTDGVDYWKNKSSASFTSNSAGVAETCTLEKVVGFTPLITTFRKKQSVLSIGTANPSRWTAPTNPVKYGAHAVSFGGSSALAVRDQVLSDGLYNFWPRQGGYVAADEQNYSNDDIIEAQNNQQFTFETWIYASANAEQVIAGKGDPTTPGGWMLYLIPVPNGGYEVAFKSNNIVTATGNAVAGNTTSPQWAHVAVVLRDRKIKLFVDGTQRNIETLYSQIKLSSPTDFVIGRHPTKNEKFFGDSGDNGLDNICMSNFAKYSVNFTTGRVEPDEHTMFLIDGEDWLSDGDGNIISPEDDSIEILNTIRGTFVKAQRFVLQGGEILKDLDTDANAKFYDFSCVNAVLNKDGTPHYNTTITDPAGGTTPNMYFDGTEGLSTPETQITTPMVKFTSPQGSPYSTPNYYNYTPEMVEHGFLFETWFYPEAMSNGDEQFIAGILTSTGVLAPWILTIKKLSGTVKVYWTCEERSTNVNKQLIGTISEDAWNHVQVIFNGTHCRLFVDGVQTHSIGLIPAKSFSPANTRFCIAKTQPSVTTPSFKGYMFNVRLLGQSGGSSFLSEGYYLLPQLNLQYGAGSGVDAQPYFTPSTKAFIGNIIIDNDGKLIVQQEFIAKEKILKATRPEDTELTETTGGQQIWLVRWGSGRPYPTYITRNQENDTCEKNRPGIDESTWVPGAYGDLDGTSFSSHRGMYITDLVGHTPTVTTHISTSSRFFAQKIPLRAGDSYTIKCAAYRDANTSEADARFRFVVWKDSGEAFYASSPDFTVRKDMSSIDENGETLSYTFTAPKGSFEESWIGVELQAQATLYFDNIELLSAKGFPLSKSITVNEKLRGPTVDQDGNPAGDNYSPDMFAKKYRILNSHASGAEIHIKINQLHNMDKESGDVLDESIDSIIVKYRPLIHNNFVQYYDAHDQKIEGRVDQPFIYVFDIDFHPAISGLSAEDRNKLYGWEIKVYRTEPESTVTRIKKSTDVHVVVEKYDTRVAYPNSAVIKQRFNAEYFNQIPARSADVRLLRVRVPSNYNPLKKTYDESQGPWDGTWKTQKYWSDNPAWCFLDLITNPRYGLGKYIPLGGFDKWTLYKIAQYCDVIVPDGAGGMEPRLTCNVIINSREDAFKVINDMASVFRGLLYYAAGQIYAIQDAKKDPIYTFTNANIQDGNFTYSNKSRKERYNVGIIRYNDKTNFYKPAIEYVEDIEGIRNNGIREQEITAFGCTSRGQAIRLGKWLVYTNNLEVESVSFKAGVEASYLRPGDNISISDRHRNPFRWGGRTTAISGVEGVDTIQLDSFLDPTYINNDQVYKLSLMTPGWNYDSYNVSGMNSSDTPDIRRSQVQNFLISGSFIDIGLDLETTAPPKFSTIKLGSTDGNYWPAWLAGGFDGSEKRINRTDYIVSNNTIWTLNPTGKEFTLGSSFEASTTKERLYRIVNVNEDEKQIFTVKAVENDSTKYDKIEDDLLFEQGGLYNSPTLKVPDGPTTLALKVDQFSPNSAQIKYSIGAPTSKNGLDAYQIFAKENSPFFSISDFTGNYPVLWTQYTGSSLSGRAFLHNTPLTKVISSGTQYIPDGEHRIARISATKQARGVFRPEESGSCVFKVFSVNAMNQYSLTSRMDRIIVPSIHPIQDVRVENLGLSTSEDSRLPIEKKKKARLPFTGGSPEVLWASTLAGSGFVPSSYAYRITVREPSYDTSIPNPNILQEITGYRPVSRGNNISGFGFTYGLTGNLFHTSGRRDFDIVVEAHNEHGQSSAGGMFGDSLDPSADPYYNEAGEFVTKVYRPVDSTYTNEGGYDLVRLNNPAVYAHLSSEGSVCASSDNICTTQQITLDNKVKMVFEKNSYQSFNRDVVGGFLYVSPQPFDVTGVQGVLISDLRSDIQRIKFDYAPTIEIAPIGDVLLDGSAYIAYSLYDTFDQERDTAYRSDTKNNPIKNRGFDMARLLSVSSVREVKLDDTNTVRKIIKQGKQTLTFELPAQRQWHFLKVEGSLQGKRVLYTNTESQNEKWQELSELKNWKIYVNDVRVDQAENWASNPPSDKNFVFCKNSKWNGSTDLLPVFNILSKGVPLEQFNRDATLTVKLEFESTNVDFVNFSAEADYGRRY